MFWYVTALGLGIVALTFVAKKITKPTFSPTVPVPLWLKQLLDLNLFLLALFFFAPVLTSSIQLFGHEGLCNQQLSFLVQDKEQRTGLCTKYASWKSGGNCYKNMNWEYYAQTQDLDQASSNSSQTWLWTLLQYLSQYLTNTYFVQCGIQGWVLRLVYGLQDEAPLRIWTNILWFFAVYSFVATNSIETRQRESLQAA